jgi:hypothetical protein
MAREKLNGGYVNGTTVDRESGLVYKTYQESTFSATNPSIRFRRELYALKKFPGLAPGLIEADFNNLMMVQELIPGDSFEVLSQQGEKVHEQAGEVLRQIHSVRFNDPPQYLKESFEKKVEIASHKSHAQTMLELIGVSTVDLYVNWEKVYELGTTVTHGDFWFRHLIKDARSGLPRVIDWEYTRPYTPYHDFVSVQQFIIGFFGGEEEFWRGYGMVPDKDTLNEFIKFQSFRYLAHITSPQVYLDEGPDGFYHKQAALLTKLVQS